MPEGQRQNTHQRSVALVVLARRARIDGGVPAFSARIACLVWMPTSNTSLSTAREL
jgi:hypothetical protein